MIKTRLIKLLSHAKKYIVYQVLWQWLALICQIVILSGIARVIGRLYKGTLTTDMLLYVVCQIVIAIVLRFVFDFLATKASYAASVDVKKILRVKIYEKLLSLGASYREKVSSAEIVQMSVEGVEQLEIYFGKYLSQLFYSLLAPITLFVILVRVNAPAAIVLLICVPLIPVSIVAVQKIAKRLLSKYWGIYTGLGDSFLENLQGLVTLKIFGADDRKAVQMDEQSEHFRKITMKVLTMQLNSTSVMDIVAYAGAAVGMVVVIFQFLAGNVDAEGAVRIILLASEFFIPLRLLGSFFHIAMNGMAASDKIFAFLDLEEPISGSEQAFADGYDISFQNVIYSYDGERNVLKGIDLEIAKGSLVSVVGASGCGKSTIAGVLMGKNKGYAGSIKLGGTELREASEESLMLQITLVTHESYLFGGSVRENLLLGKPEASEQEMEDALKKVNLYGFLQENEGLDTMLSEQAANLSGGQRQRLALARALLHDSPVYIFDEATSNIDVESEELIMKVVHELARVKSVILISHRLANVTTSDKIYMLNGGGVKQAGTHEQLMKADGPYATLYRKQQELEVYRNTVKGGADE
ncbi:MAG: ABC transporter ATP-binding protein/permease [Eubacterium sp.]|nr:ABC transporter ATP-binding protein/permease [Eubacterium sp.]